MNTFILPLLLLLTTSVTSFNMCSPIKLGEYSFDISTLFSQTIGLPGGAGRIDFFNCNPSTCNNSNIASPIPAMNTQ